jgi:ornithine cyclodeaminase/alanine dehydrogenase-like protein (mu-crystallin family)
VLFPGSALDVPAYTVKVHAKFPAEQPAIRGVLCLHDVNTGELLAVMDSTYLTAVRTGIVSAMAANTLARPHADTVAVIGAGVQGRHQLRALKHLRLLRSVCAYDVVPERAATFAQEMARELDLPVRVAPTAEAAIQSAAIVLVATWSSKPFIFFDMLASGAHINTLGADEPAKGEVDGDAIRRGLFVCVASLFDGQGGRRWNGDKFPWLGVHLRSWLKTVSRKENRHRLLQTVASEARRLLETHACHADVGRAGTNT